MQRTRRAFVSGATRGLPLLAAVLLLLNCGGCGADGEHAEDDHHMEHFVPAHKPPSFAEGVAELTERCSHLKYHIGEQSEIVEQELTELVDIIGWIPELAADSDLNETDWVHADSVSREMLAIHEASAGVAGLEGLLADLTPLIESLEPLVPRAGRPEPAIHHDHDHDHGHGHHHGHDHPHAEPDAHADSDAHEQEHEARDGRAEEHADRADHSQGEASSGGVEETSDSNADSAQQG